MPPMIIRTSDVHNGGRLTLSHFENIVTTGNGHYKFKKWKCALWFLLSIQNLSDCGAIQ